MAVFKTVCTLSVVVITSFICAALYIRTKKIGKKRELEDPEEISSTSKSFKSTPDEDEPIYIVPESLTDDDGGECSSTVASEKEKSTTEITPDGEEEIVIKCIKDTVNTISVPENDCQSIVAVVTNDLKCALEPLDLDKQFNVVPFGSFISGLACFGSDLDFYLDTSPGHKSSSRIQSLLKGAARELRKSKAFSHVFPISNARIPIVRFRHKAVKCECDLSFTNEIGVRNTLLVRFYLSLNQHLKPLVLFLKYLLEHYNLHGCQKITTYMLFWLVVYYMQQRDILPPVRSVRGLVSEPHNVSKWDCRVPAPYDVPFYDSLSLFSHLKAFLKFYSEFSFLKYVISPYLACPILVDDFENLRLPFDFFSVYFQKVQNTEDATFITSVMNLQDPTELNLNITRPVELQASNQFRSFCCRLYNFFSGDIAKKLATSKSLKNILPKTLPKGYHNLPDDCIQCETHKLNMNRLPLSHPARGTFEINGVFFFGDRLETVMKSDYKFNVQTTISDQVVRIRRKGGTLYRKMEPVVYFRCKKITNKNREDAGKIPSEREALETELFVLLDSTFNGEEIPIHFEGKSHLLQRIKCEQIIRSIIQIPE